MKRAIFRIKCIKIRLTAGIYPDLLGELTVYRPRPDSSIKGIQKVGEGMKRKEKMEGENGKMEGKIKV